MHHVWPSSWSAARLVPLAAFLLVLVLGATFRLRELHLTQGRLDIDEARLVLAAQGVAEHGWPVLPSGKVYTRGLVQSLLMAPSLIIFGQDDVAARLPSVVCGVLLMIVVYAYGHSLAGPPAGLFAALLSATSGPLISASREAWLYSTFVLLWTTALYLFDRALALGRARPLLLGAAAVALSFFAHELTVLLLPAVALGLLLWLRVSSNQPRRAYFVLASLLLIGAALTLLAAFSLALRSDTLAGSLGEVRQYLSFRKDLSGIRFYFDRLTSPQSWLLSALILAALLLAPSAQRRRLLVPLAAILPLLLVDSFILPELRLRYGLTLMPTLFVLAGVGVTALATRLHQHLSRSLASLVATCLYLLTAAAVLYSSGVWSSGNVERTTATWVTVLHDLGYQPGDLVLTDVPTVTYRYLGRADAWLRSRRYEKYIYRSDELRDIHTDAVLVRSLPELNGQVRSGNKGRTAWVIGSDSARWNSWVDQDLREYVEKNAIVQAQPKDQRRIYKLEL